MPEQTSRPDPLAVAVANGKPVRLPEKLTRRMANRAHRLHHYLWHQTRNSWARYPQTTRAELTRLGWSPSRVHQDWNGDIVLNNDAGEDFLYMHRQMIHAANAVLREETGDPYAHVVGWARLPEPGDPVYPVPEPFDHPDGFLREMILLTKTDEYFEKRLRRWEMMYTSAEFLRSVSLGQFGSRLEATLHDAIHVRWSAKNELGHRLDPGAAGTPSDLISIESKWDDVRYNFLADEYSSHVHPMFFRIHGWVDDRISDWMIANGVRVGFHTSMPDPPWRGTWEGVLPPAAPAAASATRYAALLNFGGHMHDHGGHDHGDGEYVQRLEQAVKAVLSSGCIHHTYARPMGR